MTSRIATLLTLAALTTAGLTFTGCEGDDSRPSRPRTENPFGPGQQAKDRAEQRALEAPSRTSTGSDAPRQLNKADMPKDLFEPQVVLLQAGGGGAGGAGGAGSGSGAAGQTSGIGGQGTANPSQNAPGNQPSGMNSMGQGTALNPQGQAGQAGAGSGLTPGLSSGVMGSDQTAGNAAGSAQNLPPQNQMEASQNGAQGGNTGWSWNMIGNYHGPTNSYNRDMYFGPMPHLPANPGSVPMTGATPVAGTGWAVDHSWGQGLVLQDYPHRAWPEEKSTYERAPIKHNPTYYFNVQPLLNVQQPNGSYTGDWVSDLYEVPWFYLNTAALPVLMVLEPPLAQRTTERLSLDPNFNGHLPPNGAVVPTPEPGDLRWTYPFLNPDGSVKERGGPGAASRIAPPPTTQEAPR